MRGVAVDFVEAFDTDPQSDTGLRGATLGGKQTVTRPKQVRQTTVCSAPEDIHYVRVFATRYTEFPEEDWVTEPAKIPQVECPTCRYQYGPHSEFVERVSDVYEEKNHYLREVSRDPVEGHVQVNSLTRHHLVNYDRIALHRTCQNCGETHYFLYRTREVDGHLTPIEIIR